MTETRTRSVELYDRARMVIPGGVNSPVRAFNAVGGAPMFVAGGKGPYLRDADGNRLIDYVMSWGPLIHGHAFEPVVTAIQRAAETGTSFGLPTERESRLAEMVIGAVPGIEMIRFVNSGTEAAMSALRLARAATGRDLIVKFAGNYHGHVDGLLVQAGSGILTLGLPSSPGVPAATAAATLVLPYNDLTALGAVFERRGSDIAAVIVEPIAANMGVVAPAPGFLACIERLASEHGSMFICDEVITGFRVDAGGAQRLFDLLPDITILGKIIGGGLPVGAYGGRRKLMEMLAPIGPVYQAGTLSGNPLAMAAGVAALEHLQEPDFYTQLGKSTDRLAAGLRASAARAGVPVRVTHVTGMLTVFFTDGPARSLEECQRADTALFARFFHAMLRRDVLIPPSQFEAWMVSAAHGEDVIAQTLDAIEASFIEIS